MPDKKNNLGSATRRVLFDFLGELKVDQDKKETTRKSKNSESKKDTVRNKNDIQLFSKKLSNQNEKSDSAAKDDDEENFSECKKIVLSDEETNRLMALKEEDEKNS